MPCSQASRSSKEPLYGTCGSYDHWAFVSAPISSWHATSALKSHGMPPDVTDWLGEELGKGVKISFRVYDDPSVAAGATKVKLFPAGQEIVLPSLTEITGALRRRIAGDAEGWTRIDGHEFFICNDPGHDACCAKYGPPVFEAAARLIAERGLSLKVFRCSHLGGHKFAATGILFPHGHLYGRMDEKNISDLLATAALENVYAPCYRGGAWLSKDAQIATYVAADRGWLGGPLKHVRVNEVVESGENRRHLHAEVIGALPFTVELDKKIFSNPPSCGASDAEKTNERWVIAGVNGK